MIFFKQKQIAAKCLLFNKKNEGAGICDLAYARVALLLSATIFSSCAGPTSPLGAVWALTPAQALRAILPQENSAETGGPKIRFSPSRQILHGPSPLRVIIEDDGAIFADAKHGKDFQIEVHYDDLDVSRNFLKRTTIISEGLNQPLVFEHPKIRLSPETDHKIEVTYRSPSGKIAFAKYEPPQCKAVGKDSVVNLGGFSPPSSLIKMIGKVSSEDGINPSFATALVAQESAFNSRAVSWARAVGLTQVTPIAEQEVARQFSSWPRYPGINEMPMPILKAMIFAGKVNSTNEWRLNRELSLRGGLSITQSLAKRWSTSENEEIIRRIARDNPETERSRLILASYQSGYSRVATAVNRYGSNWLEDDELSEARKYINRIFSYCYTFSDNDSDSNSSTEDLYENSS